MPGWRDFERTIALVFGGEAQENKSIFDVLVPRTKVPSTKFGISCKMRSELDKLKSTGRAYVELSNSAGKFWRQLKTCGVTQKNYLKKPEIVGKALIGLVKSWHDEVSIHRGGIVDLDESFYLFLLWNKHGVYQLHQFGIHLPEATLLRWRFPTSRCLRGDDGSGTVFEWYGESGGQLKYYPLAKNATWSSVPFRLEPIKGKKGDVLARVAAYFPEHWKKLVKSVPGSEGTG